MPPRFLSLATLVALAACGSGTIRTTDDSGAGAPAPSPAPTPPVAEPIAPAPAPATPTPPPQPRAAGPQSDSIQEIRRIGRWVSSGIKGARRLVIREQVTLSRFWSELGAGVQPQVDFGRDLVIAVASGERSSGGHDIAVQRVSRKGGELRIEVVETAPGADCMTASALTQPVDVVIVPSGGVTGWSFIDRRATRAC